jgi:TRAP-type C4-dicarboxylate transport system permease large subunit
MKRFNTNLLALLNDAPHVGVMMLTCYSIALLLAPPVGLLLLALCPAYVNFLAGGK